MSFTEQLRKENDAIFQLIFNHPFVDGIGKGEVPKEAIKHYVKADFEYLNAFMKIYGIAISKSTKREDIQYFHDRMGFILNDEIHPHHNFCDYIGVPYDSLQAHALPPTADHYIKHMMFHAHTGSMAEILGALLPCPWTYFEIGKELMKKYEPNEDHPFYQWISFYATQRSENVSGEMRKRLDRLAENASTAEIEQIKTAFRKSCELELGFWEMAYTCEDWTSEKVVVK